MESIRGWLFITCEEGLAILLGGHFQKREHYLGGDFMRSGIKYFPVTVFIRLTALGAY